VREKTSPDSNGNSNAHINASRAEESRTARRDDNRVSRRWL
jgi:hypothetical protein